MEKEYFRFNRIYNDPSFKEQINTYLNYLGINKPEEKDIFENNNEIYDMYFAFLDGKKDEEIIKLLSNIPIDDVRKYMKDDIYKLIIDDKYKKDSEEVIRNIILYNNKDKELFKELIGKYNLDELKKSIINCASEDEKLKLIYEVNRSLIIDILNTTISQELKVELLSNEIINHQGGIIFSDTYPTIDYLRSISIPKYLVSILENISKQYETHEASINKALPKIKELIDEVYSVSKNNELEELAIKLVNNKIFFAYRYLSDDNKSKMIESALKNGIKLEDINDLKSLPDDVIKSFLKNKQFEAIFYKKEAITEAEIKNIILNTGTKYLSRFSSEDIEKIDFTPMEQEILKNYLDEDKSIVIFLKDVLTNPEKLEKYVDEVKIPHKYIYTDEFLKYTAIHNKQKFVDLITNYKKENGKPRYSLKELSERLVEILPENIDLLNLIDESYTEKNDEIKDIIINHINEAYDKEEALMWLVKNNYIDEASECAKNLLVSVEDSKYLKYIKNYDEETIRKVKYWVKDDFKILAKHIELLNIKEIVMYALQFGISVKVYQSLSKKMQNDYDVASSFVRAYKDNINLVNQNLPFIKQLRKDSVIAFPELFSNYQEFKTDEELYRKICRHNPETFVHLDKALQTKENYELIEDNNIYSFPVKLVIRCLNENIFNIKNEDFQNSLLNYIRYTSKEIVGLKYNEDLFNFFKNNFKNAFNYILQIYINNPKFIPEEYKSIVSKSQSIIMQISKYNVTENQLFNYDLVNTIYPNMGILYTLNLLQYNTPAADNLAELLKNNYLPLIKKYISLLKDSKIVPEDDKFIHTAFANFPEIKNLVINLINNYEELTNEDMYLFKQIIYNPKMIKISTLKELRESKQIILDKLDSSITDPNIITKLFGCDYMEKLRSIMHEYQLNNYVQLNKIYQELAKKGISTKEYKYTNKEIEIIQIISKLLNEKDGKIKNEITKQFYEKYSNISFKEDLDNIINKTKKLYGTYINAALTKVSITPTYDIDGVKVIELNKEPFNFLVHKIHVYQEELEGFTHRIIESPERLFDMYGSNLLSTSSINEKNLKVLLKERKDDIILVYDEINPESFLCMGPEDQGINRGLMQEQTVGLGSPMTDLKSLNRQTNLRYSAYNEVGLKREGQTPSAVLCFNHITNSAKLFAGKLSKVLNKDIPVIIIDEKAYENINKNEYINAKNDLKNGISNQLIDQIMYTNQTGFRELKYDIYDMIAAILEQYNNAKISFKDAISYINHIQTNCLTIHTNSKNPSYIITNSFKQVFAYLYNKSGKQDFKLYANINDKDEVEFTYEQNGKLYQILFDYNIYKQRHEPNQIVLENCVTNLESLVNPSITTPCELIGNDRHNLLREKNEYQAITNINNLTNNNIDTLIKEFVISFIYGNFSQTIEDFCLVNGNIKRKSFPKIDSLEANESFKPDFSYNPHHKNLLFQDLINNLDSSNVRIINETISKLESFDEESLYNIFKDYFELNKIKINYKKIINSRLTNCIVILNRFVEKIEKESIYGK